MDLQRWSRSIHRLGPSVTLLPPSGQRWKSTIFSSLMSQYITLPPHRGAEVKLGRQHLCACSLLFTCHNTKTILTMYFIRMLLRAKLCSLETAQPTFWFLQMQTNVLQYSIIVRSNSISGTVISEDLITASLTKQNIIMPYLEKHMDWCNYWMCIYNLLSN